MLKISFRYEIFGLRLSSKSNLPDHYITCGTPRQNQIIPDLILRESPVSLLQDCLSTHCVFPSLCLLFKKRFTPSQYIDFDDICHTAYNCSHPSFDLQTVTRFHRLGLQHYYRIICHLALLKPLGLPL